MTVQPQLQMFRQVSLEDLNRRLFYSEMKDFGWVEEYFEFTAAKAELQELRKERKALQIHPLTNKSKLKALKPFYDRFREGYVKKLSQCFSGWNAGGHDPFINLLTHGKLFNDRLGDVAFPANISWKDLEEAVLMIPEQPGAISLEQRSKAVSELDSKISQKEVEFKNLRSKNKRFFNRGTSDLREDFVNWWVQIQRKVNAPCGPNGVHLDYSSPEERAAYEKLKIRDFINKSAKFQPARYRFEPKKT